MNKPELINGAQNGTRKEFDFYSTPPDATIALMKFLKLPPMNIWEPACGVGSISEVLILNGHKVYSTDIRHTGYGVGGVDFLESSLCFDAIITNPPFNKSELFIEKALDTSSIVAMLLKSQYWHAKRRFALFTKTKPSFVLPLTWRPDFTGAGASLMDMQWTVWTKNNNTCIYYPLSRPK